MPGYSTASLAKKLGIKSGARVATARVPEGFLESLEPLPDGVKISSRLGHAYDIAILFSKDAAMLDTLLEKAEPWLDQGGRLWIAWPKKSSKIPTDLTFEKVQRCGLDRGIVDTKVCAIDDAWSGLCFMRRKT